jgi:hypothetical protein
MFVWLLFVFGTMPSQTLYLSQKLYDRLQDEDIQIARILEMDIPPELLLGGTQTRSLP